jgi:hypothetical protein
MIVCGLQYCGLELGSGTEWAPRQQDLPIDEGIWNERGLDHWRLLASKLALLYAETDAI